MRYAFGFGIALLVIFFCLKSFEPSGQVWKVTINLLDQEVDLDSIKGLPFLVSQLSFTSDFLIERQELEYLTDLHDNCIVSTSSIKRAVYYLKQKNKFKSVTFECIKEGEKYILLVDVTSCWTFSKVVFKGLLRGNDAYRNYYTLESGDPFDINKHRHSIEKIQQSFKDDGYYNCIVADYLAYDYPSKSVKVVVVLNPGLCFILMILNLIFLEKWVHVKICVDN